MNQLLLPFLPLYRIYYLLLSSAVSLPLYQICQMLLSLSAVVFSCFLTSLLEVLAVVVSICCNLQLFSHLSIICISRCCLYLLWSPSVFLLSIRCIKCCCLYLPWSLALFLPLYQRYIDVAVSFCCGLHLCPYLSIRCIRCCCLYLQKSPDVSLSSQQDEIAVASFPLYRVYYLLLPSAVSIPHTDVLDAVVSICCGLQLFLYLSIRCISCCCIHLVVIPATSCCSIQRHL